MRIVLLTDISGTRNGQTWPTRNSIVDLPDDEAIDMCEKRLARPAGDVMAMETENAVLPPADVENRVETEMVTPGKRGPGRPRTA